VEEHRHRCEVRQVLAWRTEDRGKAMDYLARVRQKRGDQAADRLEKDCRTQWERGNRGERGDWRGL
jgi:RNase P protein component